MECQPPRDGNNADYSYICFLGDYEGGNLLFEDGSVVSELYRFHNINGKHLTHWNEPITRGAKYSIVIYKRNDKPMHRIIRTKALASATTQIIM